MKKIENNEIAVLMSAASTLAGNISSLFSMFLTVVFGALAFSGAISLRGVGPNVWEYGFSISLSSLLIGFSLMAFFIISFMSFQKAQENLYLVLKELSEHTDRWKFTHNDTKKVFKPHCEPLIGNLGRESLGFIIGSVCTVISFLWIANMCRV